MIKAAIIGAGFIGPAHIEALRRLGYVEVVALCDRTLKAAQLKSRQWGIPYAYDNIQDLLQHPGLTVVHNCTPNNLHASINKQIIAAGKHVFSEKPLCMTSEEARELLVLAEEKGVHHGVSFVYRQFAMVQQAASLIRNGQAGKIFTVHGSYLQDWMTRQTDYNWRIDAQVGGASRTVGDIGSHWCDTVQFIVGQPIVEVMADFGTVWQTRFSNSKKSSSVNMNTECHHSVEKKIETEDFANVLLRFADGSRGAFISSQVSAGRKNRLSFEINGSELSIGWDQEIPQQLWLGYVDRPNSYLSDCPTLVAEDVSSFVHYPGGHIEGWPDAFKNMLSNFYLDIREGRKPDSEGAVRYATFKEGTQIMLVIEAIMKSHQQQCWVKVPEI